MEKSRTSNGLKRAIALLLVLLMALGGSTVTLAAELQSVLNERATQEAVYETTLPENASGEELQDEEPQNEEFPGEAPDEELLSEAIEALEMPVAASSGIVHQVNSNTLLQMFLMGQLGSNNDIFEFSGNLTAPIGAVQGRPGVFTGIVRGNATITGLRLAPRAQGANPDAPYRNDIGFIRLLGHGARIEGLTFADARFDDPAGIADWNVTVGNVGMVVGRVLSGSVVVIEDVTVRGATETTNAQFSVGGSRAYGGKRVGGLVGALDGGSTLVIDNSNVRFAVDSTVSGGTAGTLTGTAARIIPSVGGLVGLAAGNVTIIDGSVYLQTSLTGTVRFQHVGGAIGQLSGIGNITGLRSLGIPSTTTGFLTNQLGHGNRETGQSGTTAIGNRSVGGFIGSMNGSVVIRSSTNEANIYVTQGRIGGFIGRTQGAGTTRIYDSVNLGRIWNSLPTGAGRGRISSSGGFIGEADGSVHIENSRNGRVAEINHDNIGAVRVNGRQGAGGFIGITASRGGSNTTLVNVQNYGHIQAYGSRRYVGGFIGHSRNAVTITYNSVGESTNYGRVRVHNLNNSSGTPNNAGGFIGTATNIVTINNGVNRGTIEASGTNNMAAGGRLRLGGFIGLAQNRVTVNGATNHANIWSMARQHTGSDMGGIIGRAEFRGVRANRRVDLNNATNHGNIGFRPGNVIEGAAGRTGGLVGFSAHRAAAQGLNIYRGFNTGNVLTSVGGGSSTNHNRLMAAGGIVGELNTLNSTIRYTVNIGNVTSGTTISAAATRATVGGIIGRSGRNNLTIEASGNEGVVANGGTSSQNHTARQGAGGIIGNIDRGNNTRILRSYNAGSVEGSSQSTGGIIGSVRRRGTLFIEDVYNAGSVMGRHAGAGAGVFAQSGNGILGFRRNIGSIYNFRRVMNTGNVHGSPIFDANVARATNANLNTHARTQNRMVYQGVFWDSSVHTGRPQLMTIFATNNRRHQPVVGAQGVPTSVLTSGGLFEFQSPNWLTRGWIDSWINNRYEDWETYPWLSWQTPGIARGADLQDFFGWIRPGADHLFMTGTFPAGTNPVFFNEIYPGSVNIAGGHVSNAVRDVRTFIPYGTRAAGQAAGNATATPPILHRAHLPRAAGNFEATVPQTALTQADAAHVGRLSVGLVNPQGVIGFNGNERFDDVVIMGVDGPHYRETPTRTTLITWARISLNGVPRGTHGGILGLEDIQVGDRIDITASPGYHPAYHIVTQEEVNHFRQYERLLIRVPMERAPMHLRVALVNADDEITSGTYEGTLRQIAAHRNPEARRGPEGITTEALLATAALPLCPVGNLDIHGPPPSPHAATPPTSVFSTTHLYPEAVFWFDAIAGTADRFLGSQISLWISDIRNPDAAGTATDPFFVVIPLEDISLPDFDLFTIREYEDEDGNVNMYALPHGGRGAGNTTPANPSHSVHFYSLEFLNPPLVGGATTAVSLPGPGTAAATGGTFGTFNADYELTGSGQTTAQRDNSAWRVQNATRYTQVRAVPRGGANIPSDGTGGDQRTFRPTPWVCLSELLEYHPTTEALLFALLDLDYEYHIQVNVYERVTVIPGVYEDIPLVAPVPSVYHDKDRGIDGLPYYNWDHVRLPEIYRFRPVRVLEGERLIGRAEGFADGIVYASVGTDADGDPHHNPTPPHVVPIVLERAPAGRLSGFVLPDLIRLYPELLGSTDAANHNPIPNATVVLIDEEGVIRYTTSAVTPRGFFYFNNLPAGTYTLFATHPQWGAHITIPTPVVIPYVEGSAVGGNANATIFLDEDLTQGFLMLIDVRDTYVDGERISAIASAVLTYGTPEVERVSTYYSPFRRLNLDARGNPMIWVAGELYVSADGFQSETLNPIGADSRFTQPVPGAQFGLVTVPLLPMRELQVENYPDPVGTTPPLRPAPVGQSAEAVRGTEPNVITTPLLLTPYTTFGRTNTEPPPARVPHSWDVVRNSTVELDAGTAPGWTFLGWRTRAQLDAHLAILPPVPLAGFDPANPPGSVLEFPMEDDDEHWVAVWGDQYGYVGTPNRRMLTVNNVPAYPVTGTAVQIPGQTPTTGNRYAGERITLVPGARLDGLHFIGWWVGTANVPQPGDNVDDFGVGENFIAPNAEQPAFTMPDRPETLTALWGCLDGYVGGRFNLTIENRPPHPVTGDTVRPESQTADQVRSAGETINLNPGARTDGLEFLGWWRGAATTAPALGTNISTLNTNENFVATRYHTFTMPAAHVAYTALWGCEDGYIGGRQRLTIYNVPQYLVIGEQRRPANQTQSADIPAGQLVTLVPGTRTDSLEFLGWWRTNEAMPVPQPGDNVNAPAIANNPNFTTTPGHQFTMPVSGVIYTALWGCDDGYVGGRFNLTVVNVVDDIDGYPYGQYPVTGVRSAGERITLVPGARSDDLEFIGWWVGANAPDVGDDVDDFGGYPNFIAPGAEQPAFTMPANHETLTALWGVNGIVGGEFDLVIRVVNRDGVLITTATLTFDGAVVPRYQDQNDDYVLGQFALSDVSGLLVGRNFVARAPGFEDVTQALTMPELLDGEVVIEMLNYADVTVNVEVQRLLDNMLIPTAVLTGVDRITPANPRDGTFAITVNGSNFRDVLSAIAPGFSANTHELTFEDLARAADDPIVIRLRGDQYLTLNVRVEGYINLGTPLTTSRLYHASATVGGTAGVFTVRVNGDMVSSNKLARAPGFADGNRNVTFEDLAAVEADPTAVITMILQSGAVGDIRIYVVYSDDQTQLIPTARLWHYTAPINPSHPTPQGYSPFLAGVNAALVGTNFRASAPGFANVEHELTIYDIARGYIRIPLGRLGDGYQYENITVNVVDSRDPARLIPTATLAGIPADRITANNNGTFTIRIDGRDIGQVLTANAAGFAPNTHTLTIYCLDVTHPPSEITIVLGYLGRGYEDVTLRVRVEDYSVPGVALTTAELTHSLGLPVTQVSPGVFTVAVQGRHVDTTLNARATGFMPGGHTITFEDLRDAETETIVIRLRAGDPVELEVRVVDSNRNLLPTATLTIPGVVPRAHNDGRFTVEVGVGVTMTGWAPGFASVTHTVNAADLDRGYVYIVLGRDGRGYEDVTLTVNVVRASDNMLLRIAALTGVDRISRNENGSFTIIVDGRNINDVLNATAPGFSSNQHTLTVHDLARTTPIVIALVGDQPVELAVRVIRGSESPDAGTVITWAGLVHHGDATVTGTNGVFTVTVTGDMILTNLEATAREYIGRQHRIEQEDIVSRAVDIDLQPGDAHPLVVRVVDNRGNLITTSTLVHDRDDGLVTAIENPEPGIFRILLGAAMIGTDLIADAPGFRYVRRTLLDGYFDRQYIVIVLEQYEDVTVNVEVRRQLDDLLIPTAVLSGIPADRITANSDGTFAIRVNGYNFRDVLHAVAPGFSPNTHELTFEDLARAADDPIVIRLVGDVEVTLNVMVAGSHAPTTPLAGSRLYHDVATISGSAGNFTIVVTGDMVSTDMTGRAANFNDGVHRISFEDLANPETRIDIVLSYGELMLYIDNLPDEVGPLAHDQTPSQQMSPAQPLPELNPGDAAPIWNFLGWTADREALEEFLADWTGEYPATWADAVAANVIEDLPTNMPEDASVTATAVWGNADGEIGIPNHNLVVNNVPAFPIRPTDQTPSQTREPGPIVLVEGTPVAGDWTFLGWVRGYVLPNTGDYFAEWRASNPTAPVFDAGHEAMVPETGRVVYTAIWGSDDGYVGIENHNLIVNNLPAFPVRPTDQTPTQTLPPEATIVLHHGVPTTGDWTFLGWVRGTELPEEGDDFAEWRLENPTVPVFGENHLATIPLTGRVIYTAIWGNDEGYVGIPNHNLVVNNLPMFDERPTDQTPSQTIPEEELPAEVELVEGTPEEGATVNGVVVEGRWTFLGWVRGTELPEVGTNIEDFEGEVFEAGHTAIVPETGRVIYTAIWGNDRGDVGIPNVHIPEVDLDRDDDGNWIVTLPDCDEELEIDVDVNEDGDYVITITPPEGGYFDEDTAVNLIPDGYDIVEGPELNDDGTITVVVRPRPERIPEVDLDRDDDGNWIVTLPDCDEELDIYVEESDGDYIITITPPEDRYFDEDTAVNLIPDGYELVGPPVLNDDGTITVVVRPQPEHIPEVDLDRDGDGNWIVTLPDCDEELEIDVVERDGDYVITITPPDGGYFDDDTIVNLIPDEYEIVEGPKLNDDGTITVVVRPRPEHIPEVDLDRDGDGNWIVTLPDCDEELEIDVVERDGDYVITITPPDGGYFDDDTIVNLIPDEYEIVEGPKLNDDGTITVVVRPRPEHIPEVDLDRDGDGNWIVTLPDCDEELEIDVVERDGDYVITITPPDGGYFDDDTIVNLIPDDYVIVGPPVLNDDGTITVVVRPRGYGNIFGWVRRYETVSSQIGYAMYEDADTDEVPYEYEVEVEYEYDVDVEYEYEVEVEYEYEVEVEFEYEVEVPHEYVDEYGELQIGTTTEVRIGSRTEVRTGTRTETRTGSRTEARTGTRTETRIRVAEEVDETEGEVGITTFTTELVPVEGATIYIISETGELIATTLTNADGYYRVTVPAGIYYTVIASFYGYKTTLDSIYDASGDPAPNPRYVPAGGEVEASFRLETDETGDYRYLLAVTVLGGPEDRSLITVRLDGTIVLEKEGIIWVLSGEAPMVGTVSAAAVGFKAESYVVVEAEDYVNSGDGDQVVASITLTLVPATVTVTFNLAGGVYAGNQALLVQIVPHGGDAQALSADPTRANYRFAGWLPVLNLTNVTEDRTFVAQWTRIPTDVPWTPGPPQVFVPPPPPLDPFVEDHIWYIQGFPDGGVRPDGTITRAEVSMILWRLLVSETKHLPQMGRFVDVQSGTWYAQAVNYLASRNILRGYPDGTFRPNAPITRAELTAVMSRFWDLDNNGANNFTDVYVSHWATRYIDNAHNRGWVTGFGDGTFRPDNTIIRAEAVTLINRVLERIPNPTTIDYMLENYLYELTGLNRLFNDITRSHWAFYQIMEAAIEHDFYLDDDGNEVWTEIFIPWFRR